MGLVLLVSIFAVATCGLVYELIAGTVASYLLGDSVTQFSTVIGTYLSAMGVGSYLTKFVHKNLLSFFVKAEILVGLVGGFSAAMLFSLFPYVASFRLVLYMTIAIIGILVGFEIPLILRILKDRIEFSDLVSKVFALDYIGALFASVLFPLILVPYVGLVRSSFLFGIINVGVALWLLLMLKDEFVWPKALQMSATLALLALGCGFIYSDKLTSLAESSQFGQEDVIYAKSSPYQRILLTRNGSDLKLYLNGNLQFYSKDEYRYHEALVHPGLASLKNPEHVLVLGGGDGLALREILKYPSIKAVTVVDLDAAVTELFASHPILTGLNHNSFNDPRVTRIHVDAFAWLRHHLAPSTQFDFIAIDLPDPSNFSIGKLFSTTFYQMIGRALAQDGLAVIQASSPIFARKSFWCVFNTVQDVGLGAHAYHAFVPSFGEWGFVIAAKNTWSHPVAYPPNLKFVSTKTLPTMLHFPDDMSHLATDINRLSNQALVRYFDDEWQSVSF